MHVLVLTMFYLALLIITSMSILFWICLNSNPIKPILTFLTGLRANFNWQGLPFFFLKLVPLLPMDLTNSFSYSHNNYFPKILSTIYKEFLIRIRCFWVFFGGCFFCCFFFLFVVFFWVFFSFFVFFKFIQGVLYLVITVLIATFLVMTPIAVKVMSRRAPVRDVSVVPF